MIDTSGGFDPMSFIKKKTPEVSMGMSPPQDPVDMYRSDQPPGVMMERSAPQTPISMNRSNSSAPVGPPPIPNVAPYQPIGGGGVVPGVSGNNTTLPNSVASTSQNRTNWIQPSQSGYSNVQWSGQGEMPTEMGGVLQRFNDYHNSRGASDTSSGTPYTPRGLASPYQAYESAIPQTTVAALSPTSAPNPLRSQFDTFLANNPNDRGRLASAFNVSQGEVDSIMGGGGGNNAPSVPSAPSSGGGSSLAERLRNNPRLGYGYNPGQWAINRNLESVMDRNWTGGNNVGPMPEDIRRQQRQNMANNGSGYLMDLPDEADYNSYREESLRPYNESVRNEIAAGRPTATSTPLPNYNYSGGTGGVPRPGFDNLGRPIPNYTAPNITGLEGTPAPAVQDSSRQYIPEDPNRPQDRWLGTQRRRPTYF